VSTRDALDRRHGGVGIERELLGEDARGTRPHRGVGKQPGDTTGTEHVHRHDQA
jgi:hypothetical protein